MTDVERTCNNCHHWEPDRYENDPAKEWGYCQKLTHDDRIYWSDYQTYQDAEMAVRHDFGCIAWVE